MSSPFTIFNVSAAIVDRDAAKYQKEAEVALEPGRMLLRILKDIEDRRRAEEKRIADAKAAAAAAAKGIVFLSYVDLF